MLKNTPQQWGLISQVLHWVVALLMLLVVALGLIGQELPFSGEKIKVFVYHKSVGILILGIVLVRIVWKFSQIQPTAPAGITPQQHTLANLGHGILYALMLAMPLSGWLLNSAAGFPFKWMDLFPFPDIPGVQQSLQDLFVTVHVYLFYVLVAMLSGHIGMALLHHIKHKNNVLTRMLPNSNKKLWWVLVGIYVALVALILTKTFGQKTTTENTATNITSEVVELEAQEVSERTNKQWLVIDEESKLGFSNNYDGIEFDGEFSRFNAELYFDPDDLDSNEFDVSIDVSSVTTYTAEWDSSLPDEEWFNIAVFPEARYRATSFTQEGDEYIAQGQLSLKGFTKVVPLRFTWVEREDGKIEFTGTAIVKRTDFGVGSGGWQDDPTVGFDVEVSVSLKLQEQ